MLVSGLFVATAILYGISCALYLAFLGRGSETLGLWSNRIMAGAAVSHVIFLGADYGVAGNLPIGDIHSSLSLLSLGIVVAFLVLSLRRKVTVLGAFITPVTLLFFLGSGIGRTVVVVPPAVRSNLLPLHIGVNVMGIAAFAIAFAAALGYVIQERALRKRQLSGVFTRLPSLDVLDNLGFRAITVGFPLLSIGIVSGAIWAVRIDPNAPIISTAQSFALLAWLLFAGVLLLRVAAGWRGRRAAFGTIVGFLCAIAVLLGYVVRAGGAS